MSELPTDPFSDYPMSTYYWDHPMYIPADIFNKFCVVCTLIFKVSKGSDQSIGDGLGRVGSSPIVEQDLVSFNGVFPEGRETFYFPRLSTDLEFMTPDEHGNFYRFCETGGEGYDIVVGACLEAAVYCKAIRQYKREEGPAPENLLWVSIKQHLTAEDNDAN